MKVYDVIVAGLGPAGSSVARLLGMQGFDVLVLERRKFPRHKPCGGGLTAKVKRFLEPDFREVVEREVRGLTLSYQGAREIKVDAGSPFVYMVMRDRFDHYLAEKAVEAGVRIREEEALVGAVEGENFVKVSTGESSYFTRVLVGADGVTSRTARALGLRPSGRKAVLLEGEVEIKGETDGRIHFDFGGVPYGYGWIFPKANHHLSLGIGGLRENIKDIKTCYSSFLEKMALKEKIKEENVFGAVLPVFDTPSNLVTRRGLLVGDAAFLVDPLLGEGIYYALKSGEIAATAISGFLQGEGSLASYNGLIKNEIYSEFEYAGKIARFFYTVPGVSYSLLERNPRIIETILKLAKGDKNYQELWRAVKARIGREILSKLKIN